jgi:serine/threonine-protein kinase
MRFITLACGGALIAGCVASSSGAGGGAGDGTTGADGSDSSQTGTDTTGGDNGGDTGMGSDTSAVTATTGPYFTTPMFFNTDVSTVAKAANSDQIIAALAAAGGWGNANTMQVDFDIDVLTATATTPKQTFTATEDWYGPDCDSDAMPVPAGGNVEGESGYACTNDGDCHLIVNDPTNHKLYEMWRANITDQFYGGCLATWTTNKTYTRPLRGLECTSADAAGFPISPLLFTADEVKAGAINHAIRFILPNNRIKPGFVAPATHSTSTSGGGNLPYYGVHLRLRADYPIASLPAGARVVARAMQKYGMYQADGGNIALTAQSDRHTTAKWAGLLSPRDLAALKVTDFQVIDHGAPTLGDDCVRQ